MWANEQLVTVFTLTVFIVEELCQTEQSTQGAGGEVTRREDSEGAVQKHEEQH